MNILYAILGDKIEFIEKEKFGCDLLDRIATAQVKKDLPTADELRYKAQSQLNLWEKEDIISEQAYLLITQLLTRDKH